jgi:AcrR family transcriptional regulator
MTGAGTPAGERARRAEILEISAALFASAGYLSTSLKGIANACGILPGSLYNHFESKEAIVVELVTRYQAELDAIGNAALEMLSVEPQPEVFDQIIALSKALAECSTRNRAAMHLTSYEPPAGASQQLVDLSKRSPQAVNCAMQEILRRGQLSGVVKPDVDTLVLGEQLSLTMRGTGLAYLHIDPPDVVARTLCHMLMFGIAVRPRADEELDRSAAMAAAEGEVRAWATATAAGPGDRDATLRAVARAEFARRGYEATTIRDIAAAAGLSTGTVFRLIQSKEALLSSIMDGFHRKLSQGYDAVLAADSPTLDKLAALTWLNINTLVHFRSEFAIQQSWFRVTPPVVRYFGEPHKHRAERLGALVAEGFRSGELRAGQLGAGAPAVAVLSRCVRDLIWLSGGRVVDLLGARAALRYSRATLLHGAAAAAPAATAVPHLSGRA